ncbi:MAG: glycosyltransferase family 4 protein [Flavobacteriaceae bacterium]|nr:glycosyltransferase family 4 protein [Flavobacteriaceae bacterium]
MNHKIDIIMLSDFDKNSGGRETWLYNFLPELLEDHLIDKVTLFGYDNKETKSNITAASFLDEKNIEKRKRLFPIILAGKPSRLPMAFSMFNELKKSQEEKNKGNSITLAMGVFEMIMMLFIKRFKKTKKVVWLRSIFINEKAYAVPKLFRKLVIYIEIYFLRKVDVIISNGDDIRDYYKKYNLQVNVIKNGIDIKKWELPSPTLSKPIHVAYIGRLSQVKGIESYLELAKKVKKEETTLNFVFHIVGNEGVYKEQVDGLVKQNIVLNHGLIPNKYLREFLKDIDICVALTFASETGGGGGTSNAMLEQMAASRIMLAWDNVIFQQYLDDENAYLAKQYSVQELMEQLLNILKNKDQALLKSKNALKSIENYTYYNNVENFKRLIF